jgi:hypothetical protein
VKIQNSKYQKQTLILSIYYRKGLLVTALIKIILKEKVNHLCLSLQSETNLQRTCTALSQEQPIISEEGIYDCISTMWEFCLNLSIQIVPPGTSGSPVILAT